MSSRGKGPAKRPGHAEGLSPKRDGSQSRLSHRKSDQVPEEWSLGEPESDNDSFYKPRPFSSDDSDEEYPRVTRPSNSKRALPRIRPFDPNDPYGEGSAQEHARKNMSRQTKDKKRKDRVAKVVREWEQGPGQQLPPYRYRPSQNLPSRFSESSSGSEDEERRGDAMEIDSDSDNDNAVHSGNEEGRASSVSWMPEAKQETPPPPERVRPTLLKRKPTGSHEKLHKYPRDECIAKARMDYQRNRVFRQFEY